MNSYNIILGLLMSIGGLIGSIIEPLCSILIFFGAIILISGIFDKPTTYFNYPTINDGDNNIQVLIPPPPDESSPVQLNMGILNSDIIMPTTESFDIGQENITPETEITQYLQCGPGPHFKIMQMNENVDGFKRICNRHGYSVDCFISRGGMSEVYVGKDRIGRDIIIKRARGYKNDGEKNKPYQNSHVDCVRLIRQEAEFLSTLPPNPNIVCFIDLIDEGEEVIIIEELVDGIRLREYVKKRRGLSLAEASLAASQLLDVISFIHDSTEYAYRDLQPTNVMVAHGRIVVIDFGGVAKAGSSAEKLSFAGYHGRYDDSTVGKWLDTYSFANTLYYMFTGLDPPSQKDRGNAWEIMKHEMKKRDIPEIIIEAIHMARDKKITSAMEFRRFFRALAYGNSTEMCGLCHSPLQPGSNYCIYCGAFKCDNCHGWRTVESTFCSECGHSNCPFCSHSVPSESKICMYCGESVNDVKDLHCLGLDAKLR